MNGPTTSSDGKLTERSVVNAPPSTPPPRRGRHPRALLALFLGLLLLLLVFGPQLLRATGEEPESSAEDETRVAVHVLEVRSSASPLANVVGTGTLRARRNAALAFAVDGVVLELAADDGRRARRGDLLARLDPVPFDSAVQRARARVEYLEKSLARSQRLLEQKALSQEELDAQNAELVSARAELRLTRWRRERSELRAPFDARVRAKHVELGEVVAPGRVAFELIDSDSLEVDVAVRLDELGDIDFDAPVELTTESGAIGNGRIAFRPVISDARSASVPLRVVLRRGSPASLPGEVVDARLPTKTRAADHVLRLPLSALRIDDDGQAVWLVDGDRVRLRPVRIGPVRGDDVTILEGLHDGDVVVDHAPDRLREESRILVVGERNQEGRR